MLPKNKLKSASVIIILTLISCKPQAEFASPELVNDILNNENSFFYLDVKNYPTERKSLPIGVFDSGTGGLTVLDAIVNFDQHENVNHHKQISGDGIKDFQNETFIYLADQANMPYGNYSAENNVALLKEHILKDAQFLLGQKYYLDGKAPLALADKQAVKAIVIACNTATAYGKSDIEQFIDFAGLNIKVIGVIDAAVRAALQQLGSANSGTIAVMATAGTVSSNGYVKALNAQKSSSQNINTFQQAGIGLAGAIDGASDFIDLQATKPRADYKGPSAKNDLAKIDTTILARYGFDWQNNHMLFDGTVENPQNIQINSVENYIAYHLTTLLEQIRSAGVESPLQSIILGCTHYPFYSVVFKKNLDRLYNYREDGAYVYRPFMNASIDLIDPAENTALELYTYLQDKQFFNTADIAQSEFYISVPNKDNPNVKTNTQGQLTYEYKYGRTAGQIQEYVKRVPMSKQNIPQEVAQRLEASIPETFELMKAFNQTNGKLEGLVEEFKF